MIEIFLEPLNNMVMGFLKLIVVLSIGLIIFKKMARSLIGLVILFGIFVVLGLQPLSYLNTFLSILQISP